MNPRILVVPLLLLATLTLACGLLSPSAAGMTPVSPNQTPTLALIPKGTFTPVLKQPPMMYSTKPWIKKNGYGIQLLAAKRTSTSVLKAGSSASFPVLLSPAEGQIFIEVTFELSVNGQILGYTDLQNRVWPEVAQMVLVDSQAHACLMYQDPGVAITLADTNPMTFSNDFTIYFSVPIESKGLKFQYRDLPQIDLGL